MIKLEHVDKYFNRFKKNEIHVINDTSLEFSNTGLVALLGPSGSGKTTLLNAIGGLDKVRKGNIYINGIKITKRLQQCVDKTRNLNIGYIFQDYKLIENMSAYDNIALVLKMIGIKDKNEIDKRVCYVLDKVGMLRYKKRPCNMLSGGERQRIGIARAIVKNPNIIIADEPTGNLDSKNSVEIMNIIKAISKDKLVILVTHEQTLAKFYASRIIELEDGKIVKDYKNDNTKDLDYEISNRLYLKDYKNQDKYKDINIYCNDDKPIKLNIVVENNNIYIKTLDNNKKIEVIDETSSIEMINDNYKNISKQDIDKYEFDYQNIINNPKKLKYSSIFNPITFITNGFNKVINYSILKKMLLIGFFLSGMFILYATSSILKSVTIEDSKFTAINKEYLLIDSKKIKLEDYNKVESIEGIEYVMPTNSVANLTVRTDDYYQTKQQTLQIKLSLSDINIITKKDLINGRMPENDNEVVVDKLAIDRLIKQDEAKMIGLNKIDKFIDRDLKIESMPNLKIVGIINKEAPTIYLNKDKFIDILYHSKKIDEYSFTQYSNDYEQLDIDNFDLYRERVELKEGREPQNDYETIININEKGTYKLNKNTDTKVNNTKLKVVGYYTSREGLNTYLVNKNTIKTKLILDSSDITIYSKNKKDTMKKVHELNLNIKDSYKYSKDKYMSEQKASIIASIVSSGIILGISLIEILLMIRSSFLSRIKEVGIYRAIGVKKKDIYIMFIGEIIAITTLASIPGVLFMTYILKQLTKISYLEEFVIINPFIVILSIILIYIFNLIVGLIPVFKTMYKRPAEILARTDI